MRFPAYTLAGGQSRRFGSDKARALLDGQALITRLARQLEGIASEIVAVAERPDKYAEFGIRTIADERPGTGPLAGLEAAFGDCLERDGSHWILLVSCDLTNFERSWIDALWASVDKRSKAVTFKTDYWHPFPGIYHADLMPLVREYLASPKASFQRLLSDSRACAVACPLPEDWPAVAQINTQSDLQKASCDHTR